MSLRSIVFLVILSGPGLICGQKFQRDSSKQDGFSILISAIPVFNMIDRNDSIDNFMYSHSRIEVQYRRNRHALGLGLNGSHKRWGSDINGLPAETSKGVFAFNPYYSYILCSKGPWQLLGGIGYIRNQSVEHYSIRSNIEVVEKETSNIEEGMNIFFRLNYRLGRHLSLELETAFYATRLRMDYSETYSLTPSMQVTKSSWLNTQTYALPSNLFLKYTF